MKETKEGRLTRKVFEKKIVAMLERDLTADELKMIQINMKIYLTLNVTEKVKNQAQNIKDLENKLAKQQ